MKVLSKLVDWHANQSHVVVKELEKSQESQMQARSAREELKSPQNRVVE